eukprot:Pgem_evm1s3751
MFVMDFLFCCVIGVAAVLFTSVNYYYFTDGDNDVLIATTVLAFVAWLVGRLFE